MEEDLPVRLKHRLYLINDVANDADRTHSLNVHSKGSEKKTPWITEHYLYCLMHWVDGNIRSKPPSVEGKKGVGVVLVDGGCWTLWVQMGWAKRLMLIAC